MRLSKVVARLKHWLFKSDYVNQALGLMRRISINLDGSIRVVIRILTKILYIAWLLILIRLGSKLIAISL